MPPILTVLLCMPLYAVNALADKYASLRCSGRHSYLYNALKFLIGFLMLLPVFLADDTPRLAIGPLLCGTAAGVMFAFSKTVLLIGYERTSVSFMTLCHAAGMIFPCLVGVFVWDEKLSLPAMLGMLLTVASAVLLKGGDREAGKTYPLSGVIIGVLVFLCSGGIMVMQKLMGVTFAGQSIPAYNLYSFGVAFLLLLPGVHPKMETVATLKAAVGPAIASALSLCLIGLVMTGLTKAIPSVILFPLFNGLGITLVCISSVFLFGEKLNPLKLIGIGMGVLGLCLVNF